MLQVGNGRKQSETKWMHKNVMTKLSEMLIRGEVDAGSTISIETTDGKKALKYEVTKKPPQLQSDSDDDDEVVEVAPVAKKSKVAKSKGSV
jgi:hypothetical protein